MDRRERILEFLVQEARPVTGGELAKVMGVSRQVIVQDIAILRARGEKILATPQGYIWPHAEVRERQRAVLAVAHRPERTREELNIMVDFGLRVVDVVVEHPVYGELCGYLMLDSRRDVEKFLQRITGSRAALLSSLTGGVHLHTVEYAQEEDLRMACEALAAAGILLADGQPG